MRRRDFLGAIGAVAIWPQVAYSQLRAPPKKVGVLWHAGNPAEEGQYFTTLVDGFRDLNYVEGRNITFEHRFANEEYDRFPGLAADLASLGVDLIVTVTPLAAAAAQKFSKSIPVVFVIVPDPVALNFADSLARPGRNMTGIAQLALDITGKRLGLLKEAVPGLRHVALLSNPRNPIFQERTVQNLRRETVQLDLGVRTFEARKPEEIDQAFGAMARDDVQAVYLANDGMLFNERHRIARLALSHRLPVQTTNKLGVLAGGFMSYGEDTLWSFRRVAYFADRIFKGEKAGDLPIEQTHKFELAFNLTTARKLGIVLPDPLLARADELVD